MFLYKKNKQLYYKCISDNIPIIRKKTAKLINKIITLNKYNSLLEIGTAYGFSCSLWIQNKFLSTIYSIEKLETNYLIATKYLDTNKVFLINDDAFEYIPTQKFDLIFLDGPKSHQEELLEKFLNFLNNHGTLIIDNLLLKKFSNKSSAELSKNRNKLLLKLKRFRDYLEHHPGINFRLIDIDDGVGIVTKKVNKYE